MKNKISLFLDSGAFSAWSKGIEINIQEYISFIKQHEKYIDVYAVLDDILDPEKTLQNQKIMEDAGLKPLPCFHFGEDIKYIEYYLDNCDYIALGGMVPISSKDLSVWLDNLFKNYICDKSGMPKAKVHGFGLTSLSLMFRYPWYSVDSTSWVIISHMGGVYVPRYKSGQWIYDGALWKISVSTRSPDKLKAGKHIDTFPETQKKHILNYFKSKGYQLGKSEFKFVSTSHKLKSNEKWVGKATGDKREIEAIVEPGLCNDYTLRNEMNIIYYLDLEKNMPKWPWAFKPKGVKGFEL
ncbi:MAG: hypothetical protein U9Q97_03765 [Acidobacteriota bacterium]|nr:hypothetical protein [Acidobacteriota bacterium]